MRKRRTQGRHIGLLMIFISLSIMVFLVWNMYFKNVPSGVVGGGKDRTMFDQNKDAIRSVESVKALIEQ